MVVGGGGEETHAYLLAGDTPSARPVLTIVVTSKHFARRVVVVDQRKVAAERS